MEQLDPLHARFGEFVLDEAEARLEQNGRPLEIAPRAFQVLCELVRRAGQLTTKDSLLDAVWGHRHINEAALKNIISQLRHALGDDARESVYIQTVSRRGYRFIAVIEDSVGLSPPHTAHLVPLQGEGKMEVHPLVGRGAVLDRLQHALVVTQSGQRQIVFLVGEAGIGKSTLVERVISLAGRPVAFGQCIEHYGEAEPYMPVLDALNNLCRADAGGAVVQLMRRVAPTWLLQLPWYIPDDDRKELQREGAGATQDRMLREFGELVDRLTAERPLLIVLEDLHWSDHATAQLLDYLARRRNPCAMMILGTFRPTELIFKDHPLAALRQELHLRRLCLDIDLEYLSEVDLGDYLAARVGHPAPESFIRLLHAQTSGLPLFVAAVVDELIASGQLGCNAGQWQFPEPDTAVPRSIAAVIENQLNRLTPEQQRALGAASVGGVEFTHPTLAGVLGLDNEFLQRQLEDATSRVPWLLGAGAFPLNNGQVAARYRFAHVIYRQVLYTRLSQLQRLQWHRRWASILMAIHAPELPEIAAELALHFEHGESPLEAAAQYAVVASRAMSLGAPSEALRGARSGLRLAEGRASPALEQDLRSLEAVALTRLYAVSAPEVASAFERARALGPTNGPGWQRTLQGCWWVHFTRAEFDSARALASEILALADEHDDPTLRLAGLNAMGIVQLSTGEFMEARRQLEKAVEVHADLPRGLTPTSFVQDPGVEAVLSLVLIYWITGEPRRARALAEQAVAQAAAHRHPLSEAMALYAAAILHSLAGEFETAYVLTERMYSLVRDQSLPEKRSGFAWLHGHALAALGRIDEGLDEMRAAANDARQLGLLTGLGGFHYHYALACQLANRHDEAQASIAKGLVLAEGGDKTVFALLLGLQAEVETARGDTQSATTAWRRAIDTARSQGAVFHELQVLALAQKNASAAADPERLRQLLAFYESDTSPAIANARALAA